MDQVAAYKDSRGNSSRNAVGSLLETIYQGLATVTQISPDRETLMLVQSTRKLYNPISKRLRRPLVIEFNRLVLRGYTEHQDDPRVVQLKKAVTDYNRRLEELAIKDHQVEWGNADENPKWLTVLILFYRLSKLLVLSIGTLPGMRLFWPVFVVTKVISEKKRQKALAASTVTLQGRGDLEDARRAGAGSSSLRILCSDSNSMAPLQPTERLLHFFRPVMGCSQHLHPRPYFPIDVRAVPPRPHGNTYVYLRPTRRDQHGHNQIPSPIRRRSKTVVFSCVNQTPRTSRGARRTGDRINR